MARAKNTAKAGKPAKPAKAGKATSAKGKAGKPKRRAKQQALPNVTPDGQIDELEALIDDAYEKTTAWKKALQPMTDAKKKVSDELKARKLTVYTTADGVTATLKQSAEKLALRGARNNDDDVDVESGDA